MQGDLILRAFCSGVAVSVFSLQKIIVVPLENELEKGKTGSWLLQSFKEVVLVLQESQQWRRKGGFSIFCWVIPTGLVVDGCEDE